MRRDYESAHEVVMSMADDLRAALDILRPFAALVDASSGLPGGGGKLSHAYVEIRQCARAKRFVDAFDHKEDRGE